MEIKLIEPSVELLQENVDFREKIEDAARTCYKSEAKKGEGTAEKMILALCKRKHTAMLEHATIYFSMPQGAVTSPAYDIAQSSFSTRNYDDDTMYVTTNFRVIFEACCNDYEEALKFISKYSQAPTELHAKRYSFRIVCDRGVTHELVRHRVFSFAQESTRYVRYGDKQPFRFIVPSWWTEKMVDGQYSIEHQLFMNACEHSADTYDALLRLGQTAQQARAVLNNAIKTEIVMTGTDEQWKAFLALRTAKDAHPDMQIIANMIKEKLPFALSD